jgi:steroid delta-isomerase-like uncharacterized protein
MTNKELIHRWFDEVWNNGNEAVIDELLDADAEPTDLMHADAEGLRGPDAFRPFYHMVRHAFPDLHIKIEDMVAEDDRVAVRCSMRGTHAGDGMGMPATQRPVAISGMFMCRIKDSRIVEAWNNVDMMSLFQQIGSMPQAAAPITTKAPP